MKSRFKTTILVIVSCLFLACTGILLSPCQKLLRGTGNIPYFIQKVWPQPNAKISMGCYIKKSLLTLTQWEWSPRQEKNRNYVNSDGWVGVRLLPKTIADEMRSGFGDRTSFFLDEKNVGYFLLEEDATQKVEFDELTLQPKSYLPQYYYLGYAKLFLFPGEHIARITIIKMDGTVLEYEWSFEITWW
jgi:hypothetical protein